MMHMRTTVAIDDDLLREVKVLAARTDRTVSSVIEEALLALLRAREQQDSRCRAGFAPPVTGRGGTRAGVDLNDNSGLLEVMDAAAAAG